QRAAKLIESEVWFHRDGLEARVHGAVLVVFKEAAMPVVGSRFGNQVYLSANGVFIFGRDDTFHRADFLNAVRAYDVDQVSPLIGPGIVTSGVSAGICSIERVDSAVAPHTVHVDTGSVVSLGRHNAGIDPQQSGKIAVLERQLSRIV